MNTWSKVESMLNTWKSQHLSPPEVVVNLANACIGWAYVFGARGEKCTPANRRSFYNSKKKETIKTKCNNFAGSPPCNSCKWYPGGPTLFYDCRGFTYWCFLKGAGIQILGAGATSQYNNNDNWSEKGPIENMPKDKVCCVFRHDPSTGKMEHTLIYDGNGYYIHCSGDVRKCAVSKYKATHYAIPKGLYKDPSPSPAPDRATVIGNRVALREGPSTTMKVLIRIATGTYIDVLELPKEWEYVSYGGKTGFMMKEFIQDYTVTGKNVALRAGPSTKASVLLRVPTGKQVQQVQYPDGWRYITYDGYTGFMMKEFIKE